MLLLQCFRELSKLMTVDDTRGLPRPERCRPIRRKSRQNESRFRSDGT